MPDWPMPPFSRLLLLSFLVAVQGRHAYSVVNADTCDFGPNHHSHLVLPLADSIVACTQADSLFFLSHGATWFCPHTYDVKLLATVAEDEARATLCKSYFGSLAKHESPKHVLRPTLPAGGLPALGRGEMASWQSPVLYHVHNFGKNNDAGPDDGWNVTTIRDATTTVNVVRVLYGRRLDAQPKPAALTYLAHGVGNAQAPGVHVLSHYISTSGSSGFDHILTASITHPASSPKAGQPIALRSEWPTFLTIDGRADDFAQRLKPSGGPPYANISARLHVSDPSGLPDPMEVVVSVYIDYYSGTSDGFAGFGTMCPIKPPAPQSPTTCFPEA